MAVALEAEIFRRRFGVFPKDAAAEEIETSRSLTIALSALSGRHLPRSSETVARVLLA